MNLEDKGVNIPLHHRDFLVVETVHFCPAQPLSLYSYNSKIVSFFIGRSAHLN